MELSRRTFLSFLSSTYTCSLSTHITRRSLNGRLLGLTGSGMDENCTEKFEFFFSELSTGAYDEAYIPPGKYTITRPLTLKLQARTSIKFVCYGVHLFFDEIPPTENFGFITFIDPHGTGATLSVEGLTLQLTRPSVRTKNNDMIRANGFQNYLFRHVSVLSADNMGITVGRPRVKETNSTADCISVEDCIVGGFRFEEPHSHGSIGDTGIFIVAPAKDVRIRRCSVKETGDDAIYVGHDTSRGLKSALIAKNEIRDAGARGIAISVSNCVIEENLIRRTNCAGILIESQDGSRADNVDLTRNTIWEAGTLRAGDIAKKMIPKHGPHGVSIYAPSRIVRSKNNKIYNMAGDGLYIKSPLARDIDIVTSDLDIVTKTSGETDSQYRSYGIRRAATFGSNVAQFKCENFQFETDVSRLCRWENVNTSFEESIEFCGSRINGEKLQAENVEISSHVKLKICG